MSRLFQMREMFLVVTLLHIVVSSEVFGNPQEIAMASPSELEAMQDPVSPINGLPNIPVSDAVNQFLQQQQQIMMEADSKRAAVQQKIQPQITDLEEIQNPKADKNLGPFDGVHAAVPKLQQWLTAMDPLSYSAPTFTNPVAKQFFGALNDPNTSPIQRAAMTRMVSSPYMFNMLGNPAFADPQMWSGLVSGAAVPYPLRTSILAQRTSLPFQIGATGQALTPTDLYAMDQYRSQKNQSNPMASHNKARHHLFQILTKLRKQQAQRRSQLEGDYEQVDVETPSKMLRKSKKSKQSREVEE